MTTVTFPVIPTRQNFSSVPKHQNLQFQWVADQMDTGWMCHVSVAWSNIGDKQCDHTLIDVEPCLLGIGKHHHKLYIPILSKKTKNKKTQSFNLNAKSNHSKLTFHYTVYTVRPLDTIVPLKHNECSGKLLCIYI